MNESLVHPTTQFPFTTRPATPAGKRLKREIHYDSSARNPRDNNHPFPFRQRVSRGWGKQEKHPTVRSSDCSLHHQRTARGSPAEGQGGIRRCAIQLEGVRKQGQRSPPNPI